MESLTYLTESASPLWLVTLSDDFSEHGLSHESSTVLKHLEIWYSGCLFRGTNYDNLEVVLSTGVDVTPTDSVIYVGPLYKALQYGKWPKLLLAFDQMKLDKTYREVEADSSEAHSLRTTFPTALPSEDGSYLWLSRLPQNDTRLAKPYEADYARWIPDDAIDALVATFIVIRPQDHPLLDLKSGY